MIDFDDNNCRIGTAYTDFNFKKCLCILFLSAKRAYCSAERYPRKGGRKMKKLNSIVLKFSSSLAALALLVGVSSAASACYFWFNQPKMPKAIEKFRKNI